MVTTVAIIICSGYLVSVVPPLILIGILTPCANPLYNVCVLVTGIGVLSQLGAYQGQWPGSTDMLTWPVGIRIHTSRHGLKGSPRTVPRVPALEG